MGGDVLGCDSRLASTWPLVCCLLLFVCAYDFVVLGAAGFVPGHVSALVKVDFAPICLCVCVCVRARTRVCLSVCWMGVSACRWLWLRLSPCTSAR